jgi:hypothetical protein
LAVSGWIGFLVLAVVVLVGRPEGPEPQQLSGEPRPAPTTTSRFEAESGPPPVSAPLSLTILATYEERRRIQESMQYWDAADHQNGNVGAARLVYLHATNKGWAPAALALALTYDPFELRRRGIQIPSDPGKARACYIRARELMIATVEFYLSRLPPTSRGREKC